MIVFLGGLYGVLLFKEAVDDSFGGLLLLHIIFDKCGIIMHELSEQLIVIRPPVVTLHIRFACG